MMGSTAILREGRPSDLDAIIALDRATDSAPHWPLAAYSAILSPSEAFTQRRYLIVAERPLAESTSIQQPRLAGFAVALLNLSVPPYTAELEDVIVALDFRRAGIGRALCKASIKWASAHGASQITLEVRAASAGAIALYGGLGFLKSGIRPRYYREPDDDAILMRLTIERSERQTY
jgi:ribosomal-protein-alanine N-acetyltransferase